LKQAKERERNRERETERERERERVKKIRLVSEKAYFSLLSF
jgi:hypothetical protein